MPLSPLSNPKTALAMLHDIVAAVVAWMLAFWLRFNLDVPQPWAEVLWRTLPLVVPVQGVVFWAFGLYRGIWRYASLDRRAHV